MSGALAIDVTRDGRPSRVFPLELAGSGAFHIGLIAAFLAMAATPVRTLVVPEPIPISVELIPSDAFDAPEQSAPLLAPITDTTPDVAPDATVEQSTEHPVAATDGTIRATTLYAATLLRSPAMAQVRRTLPTLDRSERIVQLCNIEALEQIRRHAPSYEPDTLVAYAMSDHLMSGQTLTAKGGAFRSRRQWYGVAFDCAANPNLDGVASFSFKLGSLIPQSEWEAHDLNAEDKAE